MNECIIGGSRIAHRGQAHVQGEPPRPGTPLLDGITYQVGGISYRVGFDTRILRRSDISGGAIGFSEGAVTILDAAEGRWGNAPVAPWIRIWNRGMSENSFIFISFVYEQSIRQDWQKRKKFLPKCLFC